MRANEFGIKGPKPNTVKLFRLDQVEGFLKEITSAGAAASVVIDGVPVVSVARKEIVTLKRMAIDYGFRVTPTGNILVYYGLTKHSTGMTGRPSQDMVHTGAWNGLQIVNFLSGIGVWRGDDHSEEELNASISKIETQDNWEGWSFWFWKSTSTTVLFNVMCQYILYRPLEIYILILNDFGQFLLDQFLQVRFIESDWVLFRNDIIENFVKLSIILMCYLLFDGPVFAS